MTLGLWGTGSVVVAHGLRCPVACGFFVPRPAIGPVSAALTGRFLTAGPSGMSLVQDLWQGDSGFQSLFHSLTTETVWPGGTDISFGYRSQLLLGLLAKVKWIPISAPPLL